MATAFVAVTLAMTVLGDTVPDFSATPSPSASPSPPDGLPIYSPPPTDYVAPDPTVSLPPTAPTVSTQYTATRDPKGIWFANWRYPAIKSGTTPLADVINADILSQVQSHIAIFQAGPAATEQAPGKENTLIGNYSVDLSARDLFTVTLRWEEDVILKTPYVLVLNYSLASGKPIGIEDMFTDQLAALTIISTESRVQLKRNLGADYDATVVEPGTSAIAANYGNWALTESGLKITFNVYQVAPASDGMPWVVIPWPMLKDVMNPNCAAGRLAGLTPLPTPPPPAGWTLPPEESPTPIPTDIPFEVPTVDLPTAS